MVAHPIPSREITHRADVAPRGPFLTRWERVRHRQAHWMAECVAETLGVFLYVYAGVGSQAPYVLGNILGRPDLGSLFTVGFAYALGIALALIVSSGTSGGHFNPAVSITFVLFKGMPKRKAARYIVAQLLGGYIACLLIYLQYHHMIKLAEAALVDAGTTDTLFSPTGPAGIFALYLTPGASLGQVFVNEFVCDFVLGVVIWTCLDPTNFFSPPAAAPWIIGMTYALVIWGYSPVSISANAARDLGGRLTALTIWGRGAAGGRYAAISALTNIPATISAAAFYEFWLGDTSRVVTPIHMDFIAAHAAHAEHVVNKNQVSGAGSGSSIESGTVQVEALQKS
ncbi:aquaporin-like protein [Trametopsis cervina]|nr:aquaporin-like protein [Trametopsis cervina]